MDLLSRWGVVRDQLRLALTQVNGEKVEEVEEFLIHNELGLAFQALVEVGETQGLTSADFWRPLAKAGVLLNPDSC